MSWNAKNKVRDRFETIMNEYKEWLHKRFAAISLPPMAIELLSLVNIKSFMHEKSSFPKNLKIILKAVYRNEKIEGIQVTFQGEGAEFAASSICSKANKSYEYGSTTVVLIPKDFDKLYGGGEFGITVFELLVDSLNEEGETLELAEEEMEVSCELPRLSKPAHVSQPSSLSKAAPFLLIGGGIALGGVANILLTTITLLTIFTAASPPTSLLFVAVGFMLASCIMVSSGMYLNYRREKAKKSEEICNKCALTLFPDKKNNKISRSKDANRAPIVLNRPQAKFG